ncbi:MAG: type VI secretion system ATPase TssH [Gemmatimonas sp.]|jgi:type VI secretion system protein VasG|uniref:type VI secretion system ATPase TssH n=1 Tax=Gemmatimonas sp. TaxID=1962908 RepID=UPI00391FC411|nr:type VI secretion system ATPase TssH [Gemmatimonadota bacterium]
MAVNLRGLIAKLNATVRSAVEGAAGLCLSRTNYDVEVEHLFVKLLDASDSDIAVILKHFGVNRTRLADDIARALDKLKTGNGRTPSLSTSLVNALREAWVIGSVEYGAPRVRSGHVLLAILTVTELSRMAADISKEFEKIPADVLKKDFVTITASAAEANAEIGSIDSVAAGASASGSGAPAAKAGGRTPNLDQYCVDLTANARSGKIDQVLGRDFEVRQVVDILTRRRQNNPILVGEAGVGKTAVVEGFARRIVDGDVPPPLRNVRLLSLDLAMLQAGAGVKGEFENRLKGLIEEVKNSPTPIILFIDEAHTMIGAGGQAGQNDAANLLKPALARGELRTIAATTWSEYKKFFEKDPALSRRFQLVKVEEPTEDVCCVMMRAVVPSLEKHHAVHILDSGMEAAVRLSHRYLADRQLPDKAVSVLDTACARLALGQSATPGPIEDCKRILDDLALQDRVLTREQTAGADHRERLASIAARRTQVEAQLAELEGRWLKEKDLVAKILDIRGQLVAEAGNADQTAADALRTEYTQTVADLEALQGDTPLVRPFVDASIVGEVISGWTGIPVGKMLSDELGTMLELEKHLGARVIGQDHALIDISRRVRTSKAGIEDPNKPKGVFMLVGPSGVGKTETALALSDLLYGGERNIITINMSEFQEAHTVSTLKGSPPGYVGYGEGGVLTEAVRRRPYSVVLLDEVEKAHPDVLELFFQVFDKGVMEDGEGRQIDFKNTIIILTTNAGTDTIMKLTADPDTMPFPDAMAKALKPELDAVFKPAFLGRMVIVPYYPVRDENLKQIVRLKIGKIARRLRDTHRLEMQHDDTLIAQVAARCTEVESGARNVDNILSNTLLPEISRLLLSAMAEGLRPTALRVGVSDTGDFTYEPVVAA